MAMAASSLSSFGGQNNVMLMRSDMGSSNSLVAMLTSCNPQLNFQVARSGGGGGLEDAIAGVKRPYNNINCYPTSIFEVTTTNGGGLGVDGVDAEEDVDGENEASQGGPVEKKRRLSFDQVRSLERNFEMENKLEPERKMQLAKELGLQPRQVAVWFQNRRARWKTKQLERDYEMLNSGYLKLKAEFETALKEKDVLKAEVQRLSGTRDSQSMDSSQCDSEAAKTGVLGSDPATVKETTSSGSHNSSSELVDAESPRTTDSNHLLENYCHEFPVTTTDSGPCFVGPDDDDAAAIAAVKLEDHTGFHVDPSCGYFLPPMVEQSVLPWWDWAA